MQLLQKLMHAKIYHNRDLKSSLNFFWGGGVAQCFVVVQTISFGLRPNH